MRQASSGREGGSGLLRSGFNQLRQLTRGLPGGASLWRAADNLHAGVLRELKARLDALDDTQAQDGEPAGGSSTPAAPGQTLQALIQRSLSQQPERAERELFSRMVEQLVPDEARILAALSDDRAVAVCHLDAVNRLGTSGHRILSNASRIGTECGVMLNENVPYYLTHLNELGLVALGPEDKQLAAQYELLETDARVREQSRRIEKELGLRPRTSRHSLHLSPLGQRLWACCQEEQPVP